MAVSRSITLAVTQLLSASGLYCMNSMLFPFNLSASEMPPYEVMLGGLWGSIPRDLCV